MTGGLKWIFWVFRMGWVLALPVSAFGASLHVTVPTADTRLYFEGVVTLSTGLERLFNSPGGLDPSKSYHYEVRAVVLTASGETLDATIEVSFHPNEDVNVHFFVVPSARPSETEHLAATYFHRS